MNLRALPVCSFVVLLSMTVAPGITSPAPEGQAAGNAQANNMESRQTQFLSLLDEEWQYELRSDPEMATTLGDTRYNDRLTDHSLQFHRSDVEAKRKFLARFEALDPAGFPQQSALSRDLMIRNLRQEIEGAQFKSWEMPVNQMAGPHLEFLDLVTLTRFNDGASLDLFATTMPPMGVQTRESGLFPMAPRATALKSGASPRLTWLRSRFTSWA